MLRCEDLRQRDEVWGQGGGYRAGGGYWDVESVAQGCGGWELGEGCVFEWEGVWGGGGGEGGVCELEGEGGGEGGGGGGGGEVGGGGGGEESGGRAGDEGDFELGVV